LCSQEVCVGASTVKVTEFTEQSRILAYIATGVRWGKITFYVVSMPCQRDTMVKVKARWTFLDRPVYVAITDVAMISVAFKNGFVASFGNSSVFVTGNAPHPNLIDLFRVFLSVFQRIVVMICFVFRRETLQAIELFAFCGFVCNARTLVFKKPKGDRAANILTRKIWQV
jgi:hypothetical protein